MCKNILPTCITCIIVLLIYGCASTKNSTESHQSERSKLDSFILVKSLPVFVSSTDSSYENGFTAYLNNQLKKEGFDVITKEKDRTLYKEFLSELMPMPKSMEDVIANNEKATADKDYLLKKMERMAIYVQKIIILPSDSINSIKIRRFNSPHLKFKEYYFNYKGSEPVDGLITRIVDSLTASKTN